MGDGAMNLVESLLGRTAGTREQRWEMVPSGTAVAGGGFAAVNRAVPVPSRQPGDGTPAAEVPATPEERITQEVASSAQITPASTPVRWDQENRMLQGGVSSSARVQRLANHVVNVLLPRARKEKEAREKELEEQKARKEAEEKAKAEEAEKAKVEEPAGGEDVTMETETAEVTSSGPQAGQPVEAPIEPVEAAAEAMEGVTMSDEVAQVMELARSLASGAPTIAEPLTALPATTVEAPVPSTQAAEQPAITAAATSEAEAPQAEASISAAPERVTIQIRGETVDITETGIDPTFLEALPVDMREEVLNQHFREVRQTREANQQAGAAAAAPSAISPEFLDALPPEIRAEVLEQEAAEQQRREREEARNRARAEGQEVPGGPSDMDTASFLATLDDPTLRQSVLIEQLETGDSTFLNSLPPAIMAEVEAIRGFSRRNWRPLAHHHSPSPISVGPEAAAAIAPKKQAVVREPVQLVDKSGVAVLLRLLFFPQPLERGVLQNVLGNLCEHSKVCL
jgi:E3 ubiquitin-protein ligase HUWE1